MTRKQKRMGIIAGGMSILGLAVGLVLYALSGTITFFLTPSEVAAKELAPGQRFRLGGLVENGSLKHDGPLTVNFIVTDKLKSLTVTFTGQLPDLFREGQGVVAEGKMDAGGTFIADTVLAKHDERYMPKDVADRLKEKGVWKEGETQP